MFQLNKLSRVSSKRKRIGRGGAKGGTSGRGHKGQKSRSGGNVSFAFEGGQMPLSRRLPKRGFNNTRFQKDWVVISLDQLNNKFDDGSEITKEILAEKGFISKKKPVCIKILANGKLEKKITIEVDACSKKAGDAIRQAGGEVKLSQGVKEK